MGGELLELYCECLCLHSLLTRSEWLGAHLGYLPARPPERVLDPWPTPAPAPVWPLNSRAKTPWQQKYKIYCRWKIGIW